MSQTPSGNPDPAAPDSTSVDVPSSSAATPKGSTQPAARPAYPPPAAVPTQEGPRGTRFDFNLGCRVALSDPTLRVRLFDLDTGNVLFESHPGAALVNSSKRYYVRFGIELLDGDERVFRHDYDAKDRAVLIQFPVGTLGDILGWFPYAVKFQRRHGCRLSCAMSKLLIPLFRAAYPEIRFLTHEEVRPEEYYATYCVGLFFDDADNVWQPCDFRHVGLHRTAGYILGVDPEEMPAQIAVGNSGPPIEEPYVCIAVQSSTQCKYWNNPYGWHEVVRFLKAAGYRVVCIDRNATYGQGLVWNHIPHGAEDETGERPLLERARWLAHARFFVGLSSGLSWLAWSLGTPVVMISGFTHPTNEFATPYRVINYHACNSCWNDVRHRFDHKDFLWCPRHANTPRQFECTRLITAAQVIDALRRLPGFADCAAPSASALATR